MKKLLLVTLICILVFSFTAITFAKTHITFYQRPYIIATEDKELGWYEKEVIAEFEEMYPEVEVELIMHPWEGGSAKLEMLIAANNAPDVVYFDSFRTTGWMLRGLLYDFEEVFTEEEKAEYIPDLLQRCSNEEGKFTILPWGMGVGGAYVVNVKLAKKAGAYDMLPLDDPYRKWTIEEYEAFLKKCKPLTKEGIYPTYFNFVGTASTNIILAYVRSFGGEAFDENNKCIINSPEAVASLEWLVHLNDEGLLYPNPESMAVTEAAEIIFDEKVVAFWGGPAYFTQKRYTDKLELVAVAWPTEEGIETGCGTSWVGMVVFNNGDPIKGKYAKLFAKHWCSKDPTISGQFWPKLEGAPILENENLNFYVKLAAKYGGDRNYTTVPYINQFREWLYPEMQAVFTHIKTPQEAYDDLVRKSNEYVE